MTGSILTLGLGCMVVLGIVLVEQLLRRELSTVLPDDAPSVFLMDVQPDQVDGVRRLLRKVGARPVDSAPVAMARLLAVDDVPVSQLVARAPGNPNERSRTHWVLTREQRLTWSDTLPEDNHVVAGSLWGHPDAPEVSLERGFAERMGAHVGSTLRLDVQGLPMEFLVSSLRTIHWRSFSMNFFMVAEPGVLDEAPHVRLLGLRLPRAQEQGLQDRLADAYPNVTAIRVRNLIEQASTWLSQIGRGLRALGSFAIATGLLTLIGAATASQLRRAREVALLKTLGLTRRQVIAMFAIEYTLAGGVAGLLGTAGGFALASAFGRYVLEIESPPSWAWSAASLAVVVLLAVGSGLLASWRARRAPPIQVLRRQV